MAINTRGNGLKYKCDEGDFSIYEMYVRQHCVFEAVVDNSDPMLFIKIRKPGDNSTAFPTRGQAQKGGGQIDGLSVQTFIYSRLPEMLFDLYILDGLVGEVPDTLPSDWKLEEKGDENE